MVRDFPLLTSPITIGKVTFRNRMLSAPTAGTDMGGDYIIGPGSIAYYDNKARGGAASVTVSEVGVHPETDDSPIYRLNDVTIGSLRSFALTANAIARHGAVPNIELTHCGQFARAYMRPHYPGQRSTARLRACGPRSTDRSAHKKPARRHCRSFRQNSGPAKQAGLEWCLSMRAMVGFSTNSCHRISTSGRMNTAAALKTECA
jgi:2,4-dienoyl-CoA reductase-like NADH-dependent reductase (Old Yellow Enzyme family)